MEKKLAISMFGQKRLSREGGIEIVVGKPCDIEALINYAADVAVAISELIENESAYGEIFHITTTESLSWEDAFEKYTSILSETTGKQFHIKYVDDIEMFYNIWNPYQIKYDCNIDRRFDNSKINRATNNKLQYTLVAEGINKCLKKFIEAGLQGL